MQEFCMMGQDEKLHGAGCADRAGFQAMKPIEHKAMVGANLRQGT